MSDFKVTPWEVSGDVDYSKLIKEFGTSRLDNALKERIRKHTKDLHPMLRRDFFFSHQERLQELMLESLRCDRHYCR